MKPELARIVPTPAADALQAACVEARFRRGRDPVLTNPEEWAARIAQALKVPREYLGYSAHSKSTP